MKEVYSFISNILQNYGIGTEDIGWTTRLTVFACILLISYVITKIFRYVIIPMVQKITSRTKATWDDYLFNRNMLTHISRLIPPIVWYNLLPLAIEADTFLLRMLQNLCLIYQVIVCLLLVNTFLDSLYQISNKHKSLRTRPLKGIYQMIKLTAICMGVVIIISILTGKDSFSILAGFGASAAILMLIFKDTILGLVAGVQLSANDMLRPGDWITMNKYGADGYVIEVSLTTVKVQNFDKTITTIPPYALVSDSFQNWRGMQESGGRRIKRTLYINMSSIHFCDKKEIRDFKAKGWIAPEDECETAPVNLEVFRNYTANYLNRHPLIKSDMLQIVRQMQPTPEGLPLEIYCFSARTNWVEYEAVQNEVFEHLIAMIPAFGLCLYQRPSGKDFKS